jgi:hypothetical protein
MTNGTYTQQAGTLGTAPIDGGTCYYSTTGTLTQGYVGYGAVFDLTRDMRAKTITNISLFSGAGFKDSFKVATYTNPIYLNNCSIAQLTVFDIGTNFHIARS